MVAIVKDVKENILLFYQSMLDDPYHRYRSWEHCYSFFQQHYPCSREDQLDTATLHLAFYLASWGMYRGSSQLLQKNYRVHNGILKIILQKEYSELFDLGFDNVGTTRSTIRLIFDLVQELRHAYSSIGVSPTDTLVTKVLLGTLGCIPAYDRLFVEGTKFWKKMPDEYQPKFPALLGIKSYLGLVDFYHCHEEQIQAAQAITAQQSIKYPIMKLIDMYFWNLGYQLYGRSEDLE